MAFLKPEYWTTSYNRGELPCATYVQQLMHNNEVVLERTKGTMRSDGSFSQSVEEWVKTHCPEAIDESNYELVGLVGETDEGDCEVQVLDGLRFRAYRR